MELLEACWWASEQGALARYARDTPSKGITQRHLVSYTTCHPAKHRRDPSPTHGTRSLNPPAPAVQVLDPGTVALLHSIGDCTSQQPPPVEPARWRYSAVGVSIVQRRRPPSPRAPVRGKTGRGQNRHQSSTNSQMRTARNHGQNQYLPGVSPDNALTRVARSCSLATYVIPQTPV